MTTDEALLAVRKAVELLPELEAYSDTRKGWTKPVAILGWSDFQTIMLALNAIKPSGPLVAVPRKPTQAMIDAGIDAGWIDGDDINPEDLYRAMIEEASKP